MNTTPTEEYFPSAEPRFNGGNGNGHTKAFSIKPATDPDTLAILDTRRRALADKRLNSSMQKLFCEVLDRSLNPTCRGFICKGVVAASDGTLSLHFGVSRRSIYTWKKGVEAVGYFWLSQKLMTNMEPITVYNITALRPQNERPVTDDDGVSQFGALRRGWQKKALGARKPGQPGLPLPGSRQAPPGAEIIDLQGISGETRRELPVSPEANCHHKRDSEGVRGTSEVHTHIADGKEAPKLPEFEPLDRKCAPRLRPKLGEDMIEFCKGKILALETARTAQPCAKERIAAYRARIKDVKAWAAGAL